MFPKLTFVSSCRSMYAYIAFGHKSTTNVYDNNFISNKWTILHQNINETIYMHMCKLISLYQNSQSLTECGP